MKINNMTIVERSKAPTPKFFKKIRNIGLIVAAAGGAILASPIALPIVVIKIAGYLTVTGGVLSAISQTAVDEGLMKKNKGRVVRAEKK